LALPLSSQDNPGRDDPASEKKPKRDLLPAVMNNLRASIRSSFRSAPVPSSAGDSPPDQRMGDAEEELTRVAEMDEIREQQLSESLNFTKLDKDQKPSTPKSKKRMVVFFLYRSFYKFSKIIFIHYN